MRGGFQPDTDWRAATVHPDADGSGPVPVRPLGVVDLIDEPFVLLRACFRTLVLLTGGALVPLHVASAWLQRGTWGGLGLLEIMQDPVAGQVAAETADPGIVQAVGLQVVAALTVYAVLDGVLGRVAVSAFLGERLGPMDAVRATVRRWPALMLLALLAGIAVFGLGALGVAVIAVGGVAGALAGGLLVLVAVPVGIAAYVLLLPAPVVLAVEGGGVLAAVRRSVRLVRGRFWPVLAAVLLAMFVAGVVQSALAALPSVGTFALGFEAAWPLSAVGSIAAGIVVTPYLALLAALVYADARVRTEALDLQILADRALQDAPAAGR